MPDLGYLLAIYKKAAAEYFAILEDSGEQLRDDVLTIEELLAKESEIKDLESEVRAAEERLGDAQRRLMVKMSESYPL